MAKKRINRRDILRVGGTSLVGGSIGLAGCIGDGNQGQDTTTDTDTESEDSETDTTQTQEEQLIEEAAPPDEIVLVDFPVTSMAIKYFAMDKGLFDKRGLNVTLTDQPTFGGSRVLTALMSGGAHVAPATATPAPINFAREQGEYMKLVYPAQVINLEKDIPVGTWLIANEDIDDITDLKGKTIATHSGGAGITPTSAKWLVKQAGLDPFNDVEYTVISMSEIGGAVARGEVAAGVWFEPRILNAEKEGIPIKRMKPAYGWLSPGTISAEWVTADFADQYPDTLKLMQNALAEANSQIKDDPSRFIEITASRLDMDEEIIQEMLEKGYLGDLVETVEAANPHESLVKMQDLLVEYTDVDSTIDVNKFLLPWNK